MTEDVIESARLRQNAEDAQRKCEGLLIDATRGRRLLERENLALMEEIKHLTEKLSATRAQMEELLHSAQLEQRAAWEERERKYKHIISDMKEHIRKQENVVPVSLYRTAVAEAKQHAVVSKNHKDMAASWKNKVVELQQVIRARNFAEIGAAQIWDTAEMNCSPPSLLRSKRNHVTFAVDEYRPNLPLPIEASHASSSHGAVSATPAVANRSPVEPPASQSLTMKPFTAKMNGTAASSMTATPVKTPRMKPTGSSATTTRAFENGKIPTQMALSLNLTTPFSNASRTPVVLPLRHTTPAGSKTPSRLEFTCSPVLEGGLDRSRIRASMVRAAGGRMGMQKKLREMRSPLPKQLSSEVGLEKYQKKLEQMQIRPRPLKEKN